MSWHMPFFYPEHRLLFILSLCIFLSYFPPHPFPNSVASAFPMGDRNRVVTSKRKQWCLSLQSWLMQPGMCTAVRLMGSSAVYAFDKKQIKSYNNLYLSWFYSALFGFGGAGVHRCTLSSSTAETPEVPAVIAWSILLGWELGQAELIW